VLGGTVTECDLVANVVLNGAAKRLLFVPSSGQFVSGDGKIILSDVALRALGTTAGQEVTFTAVTPGSGSRITQSN
jgi:hypothetical protein